MNLVIRAPIAAEIDGVVELLGRQLDEHGIQVAELGGAVRKVFGDQSLGRLLVATSGSELVGVAYLSFTFTLEYGGKTAWLEELYVSPPERERGVGTALLAAVVSMAEAAGCQAIDLEVDAAHARAANLYARNGFQPVARRRMNRLLAPLTE